MWTKQQQQQQSHDFDDSVASWEEQAFAEDAAGPLGGFVWPPRSYCCSFCRREFRSAQALGGHMNVHRRDRARLKHSPNLQNNTQNPFTPLEFQCPSHQVSALVNDVPNPKTHPVPSSSSSATDRKKTHDKKTRVFYPKVKDRDYVESGFSDEGLNFGFRRPVADGEDRADKSCKRRRIDDAKTTEFYRLHHHHHVESEVTERSSNSLHDLDLELRLGGLSNVE